MLFGKDRAIDNLYGYYQKDINICQTFNTWFYCAYGYHDTITHDCDFVIMRSTDQGMNLEFLNYSPPGWDWERSS